MSAPATVIGAAGNRPRGHIALGEPGSAAVATLVDLGDGRLHFWSCEKGELDAEGARALAAELTHWADRQTDRLDKVLNTP